MTAAPTTIVTTTAGGNDQASVQSRSTITTASNSNLASVSSVREKARRRWEQRTNQRWRQQATKSASADRQRPHEKAAQEEHERMLVEKASRKLREQARAEQERRQRKAEEEQQQEEEQEEEQQQRQQTQSDAAEGGDNDTEEGASSTSSASLEEEIEGQQQQHQHHQQQKQQGQNSREEEQEAAKRALERQRQQKQRQQQRSAQARDKTHDKAPAVAASASASANTNPEADASADAVDTKTKMSANLPPSLPSSPMESSFASSSVPSSSSSSASVPSSPVRVPVQNRDRVNTASTALSVATSACTPSCTSSRPTPRSRPPLPDHIDGTSTSSVDASTLPPPPPPPPRQKPKSKSRVVAAVSSKRSTAASPFKFRQSAITAARRGGPTSPSTADKADGDGRRNDPIDLADSAVGTRGSSGTKGAPSPCSAGPSKNKQLVERKRQPVEPPSPPPPPPPPPPRPPAPQRVQQYQSEQRTSSSLSVIDADDRDRSLDIQWKMSHQGNGELSFEDLRSLSIDELRTMFSDRDEQQEESPAPATAQEAHQERAADSTNMSEERARSQVEMDAEEDIRTRVAARAAAEEARSHVDRSIHRWEMRSSCDPPGDDGQSPHRINRRADPPAGDGGRNASVCNTEGHSDDVGGVMFVKIDPKTESEHPSRPKQSKPIDENGEAAADNNGAVNSGLQNLHHIAEIRAQELANTHGTVCSRSVVSELTYDDHLSVATGHVSHFSMSPSELDEEAAEIEAMEETARLNGHNLHHRILPCVKEESPSEASPDATSTPPVGPSPTGTTAIRKKTKIADATLCQLLKEAQDLTGMIDETELDVTQDDTTREEDHSQITDPAILAQMKEIQASIDYTAVQLQDAQRDIGQQFQVERMLLGEVHELLRAFGISDPLASQKIEDKAQSALHSEEEARISLLRSQRECKLVSEDNYQKAETESKLRSEVKGLRKKLAKVESKAKREESLLSGQIKRHHQEEKMLQDEHERLKEKLNEVTAQSRPADKKPGATEASLTDDKDASTAGGPMNSSVRTESATSSSQPFDELVGLSTELSMIIDEQVGMAMAMNESSISGISEKEAKATLHEIEAMAQEIEAVMQFEQTIEQLEQTQGKMISPIAARQAPQPPTLPRKLTPTTNEFTPAGTSESIGRHHLADAQIVQTSSPLKEEEVKLSSKEAGAESEEALGERSEEGEGTRNRKDTWNGTSCHGETNAEWTETDAGLTLTKPKESDVTKDTSFTMSDAVTDMNLKQYFVPGTPKRLAKKAWRASPKRAAAFGQSPKRGLGLTCSVIEIDGDQDTVSSIGSREVVRIAPDTPQRYSSIAKKCHETCGIMDSINNFWGTQGIPEGDEEESTEISQQELEPRS